MTVAEKLLIIYSIFAVFVFIYCLIDSPNKNPKAFVLIAASASVAILWPAIALVAATDCAVNALKRKK